MVESDPDRNTASLRERFRRLPRGKKVILVVFLIWAAQAIPKWSAAILANDETSAKIMKVFVKPKYAY